MSKKNKTIKPTAPKAKAGTCRAKEVGHRRCTCGGPDCGPNLGGRGR
jgi:hypothetical protein